MKISIQVTKQLERNLELFEELEELRQQWAELAGQHRRKLLEGSRGERLRLVLSCAMRNYEDSLIDQIDTVKNLLEKDKEVTTE